MSLKKLAKLANSLLRKVRTGIYAHTGKIWYLRFNFIEWGCIYRMNKADLLFYFSRD